MNRKIENFCVGFVFVYYFVHLYCIKIRLLLSLCFFQCCVEKWLFSLFVFFVVVAVYNMHSSYAQVIHICTCSLNEVELTHSDLW